MFSNSAELLKNLITKTNNHYIDSEIVITEKYTWRNNYITKEHTLLYNFMEKRPQKKNL